MGSQTQLIHASVTNIMGKILIHDVSRGGMIMKQLHVNLDDAVYAALNKYSVESSISIKDAVSKAIVNLAQKQ